MRNRRFPRVRFSRRLPRPLTAIETVVSVRRRPCGQDREGLPARLATPAANPDPIMLEIMRLLAPNAVTDDAPVAADGTASRQHSQWKWRRPGVGLAFALGQCDKKNQGWREGPPLFIALPRSESDAGLHPPLQIRFERKKNIAFRPPPRLTAQTFTLSIGRYIGKFERTLRKLSSLSIAEEAEIPRRLVSLLWYIPLFMEWQTEQVQESGGDAIAYEQAITLMTNEVERLLGLP